MARRINKKEVPFESVLKSGKTRMSLKELDLEVLKGDEDLIELSLFEEEEFSYSY
jgi:hypothetical protein